MLVSRSLAFALSLALSLSLSIFLPPSLSPLSRHTRSFCLWGSGVHGPRGTQEQKEPLARARPATSSLSFNASYASSQSQNNSEACEVIPDTLSTRATRCHFYWPAQHHTHTPPPRLSHNSTNAKPCHGESSFSVCLSVCLSLFLSLPLSVFNASYASHASSQFQNN